MAGMYRHIKLRLRAGGKNAFAWWKFYDRRFGVRWRVANGIVAIVMLVSVALPVLNEIMQQNVYALSSQTRELTGTVDTRLKKMLTYDAAEQQYSFNKDAVKNPDVSAPEQLLKKSVGAPAEKDSLTYAVDVPIDMAKGVSYTDINSQLRFSMVPQFKALPGKEVDGHLVFPMAGGLQAIYTLKNNGLKEDIIVPKVSKDTLSYTYDLKLPKSLEAKAIPGSGGAIGIYSADPMLFGDISFGSEADRVAIEKARENAEKTYLIFGIPAPVITAPEGKTLGDASARFELTDTTLTVVAEKLNGIDFPISIDPSVVVTSTSDFQTAGNNEGMIDFSTSGQVTRSGLTGGSVGTMTPKANAFTTARYAHTSFVHNGYVYIIGGYGSDSLPKNDIQYCPLNASDGSVGTCVSNPTGFTTPRWGHTSVVHNGYMYIVGGTDASSNRLDDIQYCKLNANGSVDACTQQTAAFTTGRYYHASAVSSGYLYIIGGYTTTYLNDIQHCPLNADGSIGACTQQASAFTTARRYFSATAYNNNLYIAGGFSGSYLNDIQYCPLNSNGSVGTCTQQTNAFTTARRSLTVDAYNGYLYLSGGYDGTNYFNDIQYCPLNSNGSVGTCTQQTNAFTTTRDNHKSVFYNGYIYIIGGDNNDVFQRDIQYAKIDTAGTASNFTTSANTYTTTRRGGQAVAYDGYLYVLGGDAGGAPVATIFSAPINTNGSLGTFTSRTAFPGGRTYHAALAYDGYMYVLGGCAVTYTGCTTTASRPEVWSSPITNGALGTWTTRSALGTARQGHAAFAYNNKLYVMGGASLTTFHSSIEVADITSPGVLGTFSNSAVSLPVAMANFGATQYGGKIYLTGGCTGSSTINCSTVNNNVYYTSITSAGALSGNFTSSGTFTNARGAHGMVASNGFLYITGGRNNTTYYGDTQFAPITSTGSVGSWSASSNSNLASTRYGVGAAVYNGVIYVTGGYNGTTYYNDAQYAMINNGGAGTAGTWSATSSYSNGRGSTTVVVYNNYMYILGGVSGGSYLNDVQFAPLNANGTIGTWQFTYNSTSSGSYSGGFATNRSDHTAVAYNGYMYVMGGKYNNNGTISSLSNVQYAPINANGTIGTWTSTTSLPDERSGHASVLHNGYLYVLGGYAEQYTTFRSSVLFAPINASTGAIGTWQYTHNSATSGSQITSLNYARTEFGAVVYNNKLYIAGGYRYSGGDIYINEVHYTTINSNGTIGTWDVTTSFETGRTKVSISASNGYLYIAGGMNASFASLNDVQYAPINANGTIGNWMYTTDLPTPRDAFQLNVYNGFMYLVGGWNSTTGSSPTQTHYVPVSSIARKGKYSKLVDLGNSQQITGITYGGTLPGGVNAISYKSAGANGVFGSSGSAGTISQLTQCTASVAARYMLITVSLDDTLTGVFSDSLGTATALSDFTVTYMKTHPEPSIRLKLGKTLQEGQGLSPLDTC